MDDNSCPVCYENKPNVTLNDCNHRVCAYCWSHIASSNRCPMCRSNVISVSSKSINISIEKHMTILEQWIVYAGLERKQHQIDGVRWCLDHELNPPQIGAAGGIIADEMGLGKTIQIIGLMVANIKRKTLIVMPPVLIQQWRDTIYKLTGHWCLVYHGSNIKSITDDDLNWAPIVITSYAHVSIGSGDGVKKLHKQQWDRVVYDEAHHMRNRKSKRFEGAKLLNTKMTWIITGTPIHNKVADVYAYFELIRCKYAPRIELNRSLHSYVLQRSKEDAAIVLPAIRENTIVVEWKCPIERQFALGIHGNNAYNMSAIDSLSYEVAGDHILKRILRARQSCISNHLYAEHVMDVVEGTDIRRDVISKIIGAQSKLEDVANVIAERSGNGRKKLVFCTFRGEIDILCKLLSIKGVKGVVVFDGRISQRKRADILSNDLADILLIQIQTGCEGLNLQQFKEVYFISAHWNPSIEDQAIARCHRIGQKEDVDVFRFVMSDFSRGVAAYDKIVSNIQQKKRRFRLIVSDPENFVM